jgi:hypothetical protein
LPGGEALDFEVSLGHSQRMPIARISQLERRATQSGKANAGLWQLEFERQEAQKADPLTGWNGSGDTNTQVRITFKTREEAIAFCERKGIRYHLIEPAPVRLKIQAYADNFR